MSTIHLLVIADTKCHRIGKTVQIDVDRILNQMREYSSLAGMWLNLRVLDGFHNQPNNIKKRMTSSSCIILATVSVRQQRRTPFHYFFMGKTSSTEALMDMTHEFFTTHCDTNAHDCLFL